MTDDEIATVREAMETQREAIRAALAEDLDSDPEEYRQRPVADGGE
jgi:hypothetical protein